MGVIDSTICDNKYFEHVLSRYKEYRDEANIANRSIGRSAISSDAAEDLFVQAVQETIIMVRNHGKWLPDDPTNLAYDMYADQLIACLSEPELDLLRKNFVRDSLPRKQANLRRILYQVISYRSMIIRLGGNFEINLLLDLIIKSAATCRSVGPSPSHVISTPSNAQDIEQMNLMFSSKPPQFQAVSVSNAAVQDLGQLMLSF
jgi:hypothetical protein